MNPIDLEFLGVLHHPANTRQQAGDTQAQDDREQHAYVKIGIHAANPTP
jgi:hypothetical protein